MPGVTIRLLASLLFVGSAQPAPPGPIVGFRMVSAVLYQPDDVMRRRLPSVTEFSTYIKQLEATSADLLRDASSPEGLDIVVAVRPAGISRIWFVSTSANVDSRLARLRERLEAVAPPKVNEGPVLFAVIGSVAGMAREPQKAGAFQPPVPEEWKALLKRPEFKDGLGTDALLNLVWAEGK